jgi:hypothetical protein
MTLPRKQLVAVEDTPYYHVVSRCVRRSYLCGIDAYSGKDYEYRRQWIENRIRILSSLFALDICSYCVMSNHIHIVIKLMPQEAETWTDNEVLEKGKGTLPFLFILLLHRPTEWSIFKHPANLFF